MPSIMDLVYRGLARIDPNGQSYWQVRYRDGTIISEGAVDWSLLPRTGLVAARLYCPDGSVAEIANLQADERVFQLKVGRLTMAVVDPSSMLAVLPARADRRRDAQILGVVTDTGGNCRCYAWESPIDGQQTIVHPDGVVETRRSRRPGRLIEFTDNVHAFKYAGLGRLAFDHLGIRPD